jgi:hypothetical protein|tara:strand:- start:499 stop:663 length:165 start_codon:yes stop_codon:yes gene_type:complete
MKNIKKVIVASALITLPFSTAAVFADEVETTNETNTGKMKEMREKMKSEKMEFR